MFAGSDTSSVTVNWTLYLLAQNLQSQSRLRDELISALPPNISLDALSVEELEALYASISSLPFLDNVLKESLRLIPPIHSTLRVATQTDEIPTKYAVHQADGSIDEKRSFTVSKGTFVHICVEAFNLDKAVWGDDAWEFKYVTVFGVLPGTHTLAFSPDRWDSLPERVLQQPGVYSHLLSFSGGPRVRSLPSKHPHI